MKKLSKNNSGFSLIELMVAVVVLGLVVVPLFNTFLTSNRFFVKNRDYGDATIAAQNIAEEIEFKTFEDIINGSAMGLDEYVIDFTDVNGGNRLYNAKVTITSANYDEKINSVEVVSTPAMVSSENEFGFFAEKESQSPNMDTGDGINSLDPDLSSFFDVTMVANRELVLYRENGEKIFPDVKATSREVTIILSQRDESPPSAPGTKVFLDAEVEYKYEYECTPYKKMEDGSLDPDILNQETYNSLHPLTKNACKKTYKLFTLPKKIVDGKYPPIYFLYHPFGSDFDSIDNINKDIITILNEDGAKSEIFIIMQEPPDESYISFEQDLIGYNLDIELVQRTGDTPMIYSNIENVDLIVKKAYSMTTSSLVNDDEILVKGPQKRIYDVEIQVYDDLDDDGAIDSGELVHTLNTKKIR